MLYQLDNFIITMPSMIFCEILFLSVSLFMKIYLYLVSYTYETYERYIHFFFHIFVDKIFNFFHEKFTQKKKKRILSSVSFQFFILFFFNNNHLNFNIFPSENLARRKISKGYTKHLRFIQDLRAFTSKYSQFSIPYTIDQTLEISFESNLVIRATLSKDPQPPWKTGKIQRKFSLLSITIRNLQPL